MGAAPALLSVPSVDLEENIHFNVFMNTFYDLVQTGTYWFRSSSEFTDLQ